MNPKLLQNDEENDSLEEINIENLLQEIEKQKDNDIAGPSTSGGFPINSTKNQKIPTQTHTHPTCEVAAIEPTRKSILQKTIMMNLLTLAYLFILVPTQTAIIFFQDCNDSVGECDFLFRILSVSITAQLLAAIVHPITFVALQIGLDDPDS